jgi:hypothetical protein
MEVIPNCGWAALCDTCESVDRTKRAQDWEFPCKRVTYPLGRGGIDIKWPTSDPRESCPEYKRSTP